MSVTQYIGARYVPLFADPIEWTNTRAYEPLTIVVHEGNSYTSKQAVPIGIEIDNNQFWALTGDYNAQIEQYRAEVSQFAGEIEANTAAIAAETEARKAAITAETEAREAAITAETEARETAIENINVEIVNSKRLEGYSTSKYEVFSDQSAWAHDIDTDVWSYFSEILNSEEFEMNVNKAPTNTGWVTKNSNNQNAREYMQSVANNQTEDYRNKIQYVILNFGFYDIINNTVSNYETEGRTIVNVASNLYPNAVIVVNPVSNNYCYGYGRDFQVRMYQLNYGMVRSQVPIKIVPWYLAFNINQLAINHYYDTTAENPSLLNSGGTNSVAAMLKATLFGCESAYTRITRSYFRNYLNTSLATSDCEFILDIETMTAMLTEGKITLNAAITTNNTVLGQLTAPTFNVSDDMVLGICIQSTLTQPIKAFIILGANNNIYIRFNDGVTSIPSGITLRMISAGAYCPAFRKI